MTAIQEAKDLKVLKLEELIGSLMTHELTMQANEKKTIKERETSKRKDIALKASSSKQEETESEEEDDEIALITRRFNKFLQRRRMKGARNSKGEKANEEKEKEITCFECGKKGHFKSDCPKLKKHYKPYKKKAMKATWDDSESSSSSEDEEVAHMCFMANEKEVHYSFSDVDDLDDEDDLNNAFNDLLNDFALLETKYKALKKENTELSRKHDSTPSSLEKVEDCDLNNAYDELMNDYNLLNHKHLVLKKDKLDLVSEHANIVKSLHVELVSLKKKNLDLNNIVLKFTNGSKNLNMLLGSQRVTFDKAGLGYESHVKKKVYKISF